MFARYPFLINTNEGGTMFRKIVKGWRVKPRASRRLDRLTKNSSYWRKGKFYIKNKHTVKQRCNLRRQKGKKHPCYRKYPFPHKNYGVWNFFERELLEILSKRDIIYFNTMRTLRGDYATEA